MLAEFVKSNRQMEPLLEKGEMLEKRISEMDEATKKAESVVETLRALEETSISRQHGEGTKVLQPNIELIKTQSIEAVRLNNVERIQTFVKENNELRELSKVERQYLRENTKLSETAVENVRVDAEGNYRLKCRNEELAGKEHEITGVKYVEKTITVDEVDLTVVVPEFNATFECEIPAEMWGEGDRKVFKNCTEQLRDYLEVHPDKKSLFNEQQLEQIMNGEAYIKGFSWHHSEIPGKMRLVDAKTHALSGHTGGNTIWCSGIR